MIKFSFNLILLLVFSGVLDAQFLQPKLCTLRGSSGILIQQVDEDWNKLPFDCENIEIIIIGQSFEKTIKPGQLYHCKYGFSQNKTSMVPILGEQPGIYNVSVKRFEEENFFKGVQVEWDEGGCDVAGQVLEVQFDLSKPAKK